MSANTSPIFPNTPNVGSVLIPTANAVVKSDGSSAGSGADLMYLLFTAGAFGSFLDIIRFWPVASAANITSVATTLRAFISSVASPGATTSGNTDLIAEVSAPAIAAAHSTQAAVYFDAIIRKSIPTGKYIHVCQHVAQTTNQQWKATAFGGDY